MGSLVNETASAHEAVARNRPVAAAIENLPFMWSIYDEELGVPNDLDQSGAGRGGAERVTAFGNEAAVMAMADEMDRFVAKKPGFSLFLRTTTDVCNAVADAEIRSCASTLRE